MKTFRRLLDRLLGSIICVLMAVMVLNVTWQVFTRFVLGTPSSYTEEAARYMMIWAGLLGAAYAAGQRAHLALDLLTANLSGARKRFSDLFIHACALLFSVGVLGWGGGRLVWIQLSLGQQSAALQWKLGYVYLAVAISGLFITLYSLLGVIETLRSGRRENNVEGGAN
jgi:TRAP-type C4-dicarboxylate transport system permease small subunit